LLTATGVELRLPKKLPSAIAVKMKQVKWFVIAAYVFFLQLVEMYIEFNTI